MIQNVVYVTSCATCSKYYVAIIFYALIQTCLYIRFACRVTKSDYSDFVTYKLTDNKR